MQKVGLALTAPELLISALGVNALRSPFNLNAADIPTVQSQSTRAACHASQSTQNCVSSSRYEGTVCTMQQLSEMDISARSLSVTVCITSLVVHVTAVKSLAKQPSQATQPRNPATQPY